MFLLHLAVIWGRCCVGVLLVGGAGGLAAASAAAILAAVPPSPPAVADLAALRNKVNRHFSHTPYCLRLDKQTGKEYCRFHFPLETREPNRPHIYAERVGGGVRFRLYLPLNDPLMNTVNTYQSLSQRSNTDFKPVSAPLLLALCSCCILL